MKKPISTCGLLFGLKISSWVLFVSLLANHSYAAFIDFGADLRASDSGIIILDDELSYLGVVFSTDNPEGIYWYGDDAPWSPSDFSLHVGPSNILGGGTIRVDFAEFVTDASIRAFDGGGYGDTLILSAYDQFGLLVASNSLVDDFEVPGVTLGVSAVSIAYLTISATSESGNLNSALFFDDLAFTFSGITNPNFPVPLLPAWMFYFCCISGLTGVRMLRHQCQLGS